MTRSCAVWTATKTHVCSPRVKVLVAGLLRLDAFLDFLHDMDCPLTHHVRSTVRMRSTLSGCFISPVQKSAETLGHVHSWPRDTLSHSGTEA
jgi:hypothetical protein